MISIVLVTSCLFSKEDSSDATLTKMMSFWWYSDCLWHIIQIWTHLALKSCETLLMKINIGEDSDGTYTCKRCTFYVPLILKVAIIYSSTQPTMWKIYKIILSDMDNSTLMVILYSTSCQMYSHVWTNGEGRCLHTRGREGLWIRGCFIESD